MAKTNGNGGSGDLSFKMLEQLQKLNVGMSSLTARVDALGTSLSSRLDHVTSRLDQTNSRLDKLVENTGAHWRQLERRVSLLERRSR